MSQAEARAWWADVEHLRERIERRREFERRGGEEPRPAGRGHEGDGDRSRRDRGERASARTRRQPVPAEAADFRPRRTVRIRGQAIPTVTAPRLHLVEDDAADLAAEAWRASEPRRAPAVGPSEDVLVLAPDRRRPRRTAAERVGPNPDRLAMWAVMLGVVLVLAALLSAHGL